ncbi:MAG: GNAT family N-acetyltransferase [bacterium]
MKITYTDNIAAITPKQLEGFLAHWDFVPPENALLRILRGSSHVLIAQDSSSQEVMGYITALSDGVSSAHITHLEVRLEHRNKGIGTELVRRMVSKCETLCGIYLGCAPATEQFYQRLGFKKMHAMSKRNRQGEPPATCVATAPPVRLNIGRTL